jgi:flagellar hook-associated protein 3 FlgL
MRIGGGSELARMQMLQKQAMATRDRLDVAAKELTTNLKASRFEASGGNMTRLFALERSLDRNAVFSQTISLTELRLEIMQESFGQLLKPAENLALDLTQSAALGDYAGAMLHAGTARSAFVDAVGLLNTQVAGQSLFAGTETDSAALIDADTILADLQTAIGGATTAAAAIAAVDAYFTAPGGGFYTTAYAGSADDLTPVDIGEGQRLDYGMRADEARIVELLRAHATAAVVADGALAGDQAERMAMLAEAGVRTIAAKEGVLALRTDVGIMQERVENAKAARTAERDTLELARAKIVAVDPLEAASAFQQLESQLQSIYMVTARLASLRFSNFMP